MKLSWKQTSSYTGWVKYVGKNANGKPRCFYLGRDQAIARVKAANLLLAYRQLVAAGGSGWTDDAVRAALADMPAALQGPPAAATRPQAGDTTPPRVPADPSSLTLHGAVDAYLAYEAGRVPGQVSQAHLYGVRIRMARLKRLVPDRPLSRVGYDDLAAMVAVIAARPVSPTSGGRIGVVTAADTIKGLRTFLDWLDASGRWDAPKRFERLFRVRRRSLMSGDERGAAHRGVETFTVDELARIVTAARTRWHRVVIWSALNFAMTQHELSCLRRSHLVGWDTEAPAVEKCREKTDIFCRWGYVFPEVAEGVRWVLSTHGYPSVFVGADGQPLVTVGDRARRDTIAQWWSKLVRRAGVRPLPFRFLRKTAADLVRKVSDRDTSEAMLAHANRGMAKQYTNHDWDRLADALRSLHEKLRPTFEVPDAPALVPQARPPREIPRLKGRSRLARHDGTGLQRRESDVQQPALIPHSEIS